MSQDPARPLTSASTPTLPRVDHLLWAVPDLAAGIDELARRTGVEAVLGGRHPGVGTHNALLDLGDRCYLEIIALDPSQSSLSGLGERLHGLTEPRLLTWCAASQDLATTASAAQRAHLQTAPPIAMSRQLPDGSSFAWRLLFLEPTPFGDLIPFFIEWGGSTHPSKGAPAGCSLRRLVLTHPQAAELEQSLSAVSDTASSETRLSVQPKPASSLRALLATPRGKVELRS